MFKSLAIIAAISLSAFAYQQQGHLCEGFLPENSMKIPVGSRSLTGKATGITEEEFTAVSQQAFDLYKDEIRAKGGKLKVVADWDDSTVNAQATQMFGTWYVYMYGGLARSRTMTVEGFSLVICHEIGHHLGGAPKNGWPNSWGTNEGGADYFSTAKCLRKMWENEDNEAAIQGRELDQYAQAACDKEFSADDERVLCYRTALAGQSVAGVFQDLREEEPPHFSTPDKSTVGSTDNSHPGTQCRLDTYLQGALCTVPFTDEVDDNDYHVGTCTALTHKVGLRPRCWFKPDNAELKTRKKN